MNFKYLIPGWSVGQSVGAVAGWVGPSEGVAAAAEGCGSPVDALKEW